MYKTRQISGILLAIIGISILQLNIASAAKPNVTFRVIPDKRTIDIGGNIKKFTLIARVNVEGVQFKWDIDGSGKLEGDLASRKIFYIPPDRINGESTEVVISVTVTDERASTAIESITLTLTSSARATSSLTVTPIPTPTFTLTPTLVPRQDGQQVERLLQKADEYFRRTYFIKPKEGNAFDFYKKVLRIDRNNQHAREKIYKITKTYKKWGDNAYQKDRKKARQYYQRYQLVAEYILTELGDKRIEPEYRKVQERLEEIGSSPVTATLAPTSTPKLTPTPTSMPTMTPTPEPTATIVPDLQVSLKNLNTPTYKMKPGQTIIIAVVDFPERADPDIRAEAIWGNVTFYRQMITYTAPEEFHEIDLVTVEVVDQDTRKAIRKKIIKMKFIVTE